MTLDWQQIAALGIVALAMSYVARLGWRTIAERRAAACGGGCKHCAAAVEPTVVAIGPLQAKSDRASAGR